MTDANPQAAVEDEEDPRFDTPDDIASRPDAFEGLVGARAVKEVRFAIVDGFRPLRMDLHLPIAAQGPVPVVVSIHGGGWLSGSHKPETVDWLGMVAVWQALIDRGIAVASIQYRLSDEAIFPAALHDAKAAVRWLRAHGAQLDIDPERIAAFGDSAGGYLAAFLATGAHGGDLEGTVGVVGVSSRISCAVAWYPPTRLDILYTSSERSAPDSYGSRLVGAPVAEQVALARAASPFEYVGPHSAPLLLQHGDEDGLVPFEQSVMLAERYRQMGREVELDIVAGSDHGFDTGALEPAVARAVGFLADHLHAP